LDVRRIGVALHIHEEGRRQQVRRTLGLDGKEKVIKNTETDLDIFVTATSFEKVAMLNHDMVVAKTRWRW
jgi:hypothetical protein